jgi:hypothetical protein
MLKSASREEHLREELTCLKEQGKNFANAATGAIANSANQEKFPSVETEVERFGSFVLAKCHQSFSESRLPPTIGAFLGMGRSLRQVKRPFELHRSHPWFSKFEL